MLKLSSLYHLCNRRSLLFLGYPGLGIVNFLVLYIQLSHHLHDSSLVTHHLCDDFVKQLTRVLSHPKPLKPAFRQLGQLKQSLVRSALLGRELVYGRFFSPCNQLLQRVFMFGFGVVLPLPVLAVVFVDELVNLRPQLLVQPRRFFVVIQVAHDPVEFYKEVHITNPLLAYSRLDNQLPQLDIKVVKSVKLIGEAEKNLLVVDDFSVPLFEQYRLPLG
jgi:hypothetical protein